jgi:MoxR-like ATPase
MKQPKQSTAARDALRAGRTQEGVEIIRDAVQRASAWVKPMRLEMGRVIVGQEQMVERLLVALLASGHILLEGVPGLAKTLSLKTLSRAIQATFRRIQFTPDMLPSDILGVEAFDPRGLKFEARKGPLFANLVLADEINRAPAKVQSLLLEAMQERQVTLGHETLPLPDPFLVLATQNPIEQEATCPLPEAQLDRFMMKVLVSFPSLGEERMILDVADRGGEEPPVTPVACVDHICEARKVVQSIHVDEKVKDYIVSLVYATREPMGFGLDLDPHIRHGASPRATLSLLAAARATAFLAGRGYVSPQDVKAVAPDVLRHRVAITYEAEAAGFTSDDIVRRVLDSVTVP